jgi:hypothetical protein
MVHTPPHHARPVSRLPDEVVVGGWGVIQYAQIVKWPAIITIVLNIIVTTAGMNLSFEWLFLIILTVFLGGVTQRLYKGTIANAAGLGLASSLIVGVFTSLFQFIWYHTVTAFFQIITASLLSIMLGLLMSTSAYLVIASRNKPAPNHPSHIKR